MKKISLLRAYARVRYIIKFVLISICLPLYGWAALSYANGGYESLTEPQNYHGFMPYSWYKTFGSFLLDGENGDNGLIGFSTCIFFLLIGAGLVFLKKPLPTIVVMALALITAAFCFLFARY